MIWHVMEYMVHKNMKSNIISTNRKPLLCYNDINDIELIDIPLDYYIKFGDFEDVILPGVCIDEDGAIDDDEENTIEKCIGFRLWSTITTYV